MKSFASVALFGAALVAAAPLNEKRDIVWHTTWAEVTETVLTTTTKWVAPGSEVSAAAANPGGDFHETAVHFSEQPAYTHSAFSFPSYSKPVAETSAPPAPTPSTSAAPVPTTTSTPSPPPPPPAPTTPTETYVAPTTTSTYVAPTPTSTYVAPPPPSPTTTSIYVAPTPTSVYVAPTPTSVYVAPTTATAAAATTAASSGSGSSSGGGASYSDVDLTYYTPGMGSCGIESTESEAVVAVAESTMTKSWTGNPNNNPLCGKTISITANGVTKSATIVDTCPGCLGPTDLDLSPSLFSDFADESVGRITGASWTLN